MDDDQGEAEEEGVEGDAEGDYDEQDDESFYAGPPETSEAEENGGEDAVVTVHV